MSYVKGANYIVAACYSQQVFTGAYVVYSFDSTGYDIVAWEIGHIQFTRVFITARAVADYNTVNLSAIDSVSYSNNFAFKWSPKQDVILESNPI